MARLIGDLSSARIRENLLRVREQIDRAAVAAGRDPGQVQVLAATKYVALADMPVLARAGITLVGENRAQDLQAKAAAHGDLFTWDFIGALQSRKVRLIVPHVRLIHSLSSISALSELGRHSHLAPPDMGILIQVNIAGEDDKAGVAPHALDELIERSPVAVRGLMAMPPLTDEPEDSRRWFAALRELAEDRGLAQLSMGTTQDYAVAVTEGATIVRIGTRLYT
ncbi:MAG TPA: YggS family pyridoxal phosphate-dependent enzyme [Solirubrobacteraceae bacterium]